jgi:hypothetical protein
MVVKLVDKNRVSRVIIAVLESKNKSAQRAALWVRLQNLKNSL